MRQEYYEIVRRFCAFIEELVISIERLEELMSLLLSEYKMRFYNTTMGYSPTLKRYFRVISEDFYRTLGI